MNETLIKPVRPMLSTMITAIVFSQSAFSESDKASNYYAAPRSEAIADRYIVVYKKPYFIGIQSRQAQTTFTTSVTNSLVNELNVDIERQYNGSLSGVLVEATAKQLDKILSNPNVDYVEQDREISVQAADSFMQSSPIWSLDRIDQRDLPLDDTYDPIYNGSGVTAYVIDSGINISHNEFEGRASYGYNFADNNTDAGDCYGHGTHVAGTIAGMTYGVAKKSDVVAVKVLDCSGRGYYSGVIAAINWVAANAKGPSVANISLGGSTSKALNAAINNAVEKGVFFAVAAGNGYGNDACQISPAGATGAYTVGSTTNTDNRSAFSNIGSCVDIFAPGTSVTSAWIGGDDEIRTTRGTSMASPHVAGVAALYLSAKPDTSPLGLRSLLTGNATQGKVINAGEGSPNRLLYAQIGSPEDELKETFNGLTNSVHTFTYTVKLGQSKLIVTTRGINGDADLYIKHNAAASALDNDCFSDNLDSNERCVINNPKAGTWHIVVYGYEAFTASTLTATQD